VGNTVGDCIGSWGHLQEMTSGVYSVVWGTQCAILWGATGNYN